MKKRKKSVKGEQNTDELTKNLGSGRFTHLFFYFFFITCWLIHSSASLELTDLSLVWHKVTINAF